MAGIPSRVSLLQPDGEAGTGEKAGHDWPGSGELPVTRDLGDDEGEFARIVAIDNESQPHAEFACVYEPDPREAKGGAGGAAEKGGYE